MEKPDHRYRQLLRTRTPRLGRERQIAALVNPQQLHRSLEVIDLLLQLLEMVTDDRPDDAGDQRSDDLIIDVIALLRAGVSEGLGEARRDLVLEVGVVQRA